MSDSDHKPVENDAASGIQEPPTRLGPMLMSLGPGMIIAGSIVGSGELIATTKVGAEAGFWLLWLIIIGCVIKVFTQVEFGRYTITHSQTPLDALNRVPGPTVPVGNGRRANWVLCYWAIMVLLIIAQQGGIVGAIGQAMSIVAPITEKGHQYNETQNGLIESMVENRSTRKDLIEPVSVDGQLHVRRSVTITLGLERLAGAEGDPQKIAQVIAGLKAIDPAFASAEAVRAAAEKDAASELGKNPAVAALLKHELAFAKLQQDVDKLAGEEPSDTVIYGATVAVCTSVLLVLGRYGLIQVVSTILVGGFTIITIITLLLLQRTEWAVQGSEVAQGLSFGLTPVEPGSSAKPLGTALAAFGIIGVGSAELIMYPYWCLEKGYAKSTGPNDGSESWLRRAKGWVRILYFDAWGSMVVYTFATVAFFLLGAAVLGRIGLNPSGGTLVRTLGQMYEPVFGKSAATIFLIGAFAVLYSTFFVAAAGNARVLSDALALFGLRTDDEKTKKKWIMIFSAVWPLLALGTYLFFKAPAAMVLASGAAQAIMLPMLGVAALWFRFCRSEPGLRPGKIWDAMLWISFLGFLITGGYKLWGTLMG